jgi:catechol 2,3-dioxygenase-like lactoylglutathione lyase family enzyme
MPNGLADSIRDVLNDDVVGIKHFAVAVPNLDASTTWMKDVLGFRLIAKQETQVHHSGIESVGVCLGAATIVLTKGFGKTSQFVESLGAGMQQVAFRVNGLGQAIEALQVAGMQPCSPRLDSDGLSQIFAHREDSSGLMLELIERLQYNDFREETVRARFAAGEH